MEIHCVKTRISYGKDGLIMEIKGMNGATKFVDWLLEMGYLDKEDIVTDGVDIAMDMNKVKEVAPKFYNMLMCMCDCEERA